MSDSKRIIKKFKPDLVIGTGGYVSGSVVLKASKMGIKTCIHEQNSFPGMTNKMLSKNVDLVMTSFEDSHKRFPDQAQSKLTFTGNPVRDEILNSDRVESRKRLGLSQDEKMLLVAGGSGGSEEINNALKKLIPALVEGGIAFTIATGRAYYDDFMKNYANLDFGPNQKILPYLDDMANNLAAADLVIGSAGAISMAEMTAIGIPAVIVPKAYTAENHQEYNAKSLERAGGAVCITERELNEDSLYDTVLGLLNDKDKLEKMAKASRAFGKRDAIDQIYDRISAFF